MRNYTALASSFTRVYYIRYTLVAIIIIFCFLVRPSPDVFTYIHCGSGRLLDLVLFFSESLKAIRQQVVPFHGIIMICRNTLLNGTEYVAWVIYYRYCRNR